MSPNIDRFKKFLHYHIQKLSLKFKDLNTKLERDATLPCEMLLFKIRTD